MKAGELKSNVKLAVRQKENWNVEHETRIPRDKGM